MTGTYKNASSIKKSTRRTNFNQSILLLVSSGRGLLIAGVSPTSSSLENISSDEGSCYDGDEGEGAIDVSSLGSIDNIIRNSRKQLY